MVTESTKNGLIVSTRWHRSSELDELIDCCNWPVLLAATARRLREELTLRHRACVLFWLEDRQQISTTAKLVAWLRECEPGPYRVAIVHRLDEYVEFLFRTAGVHGYLSASGDIAAVVEHSLWPLLRGAGLVLDTDVASSVGAINVDGVPINLGTLRELNRPP